MAKETVKNEVMEEGVIDNAGVAAAGEIAVPESSGYFEGEVNAFAWQEEERTSQREGLETVYRVPVNVQRSVRYGEKDGKAYSNYAVAKRFPTGRKNERGEDDYLEITFNLYPVANREALYKTLLLIFGDEKKRQLEIVRTERSRTDSKGKTVTTVTYTPRLSAQDPLLGELLAPLRTVGEGDRAQFDTLVRLMKHDGHLV